MCVIVCWMEEKNPNTKPNGRNKVGLVLVVDG